MQLSLIHVSPSVSASIESCHASSCCYAQLSGWHRGIYIAQPKQTNGHLGNKKRQNAKFKAQEENH